MTAIGLRTTWPLLPVSVRKPNAYAFSGAVVRVNATVNDCVAPGAIVKLDGLGDGGDAGQARERRGVRLGRAADAGHAPRHRLLAGELADRDRRLVQVARVDPPAAADEALAAQEREPVGEAGVVDEARIAGLGGVDVARAPVELVAAG